MVLDKKKLNIQLLALAGLIITIKLAFIYYDANYNQYALSSFCSINDFVDCDGAARSNYSQFLGIPLAYWGIFFYIIILFLTFVENFKQIKILKFLEVFKNPNEYITALGTIAFVCSMILAGISLFTINKICILCFITYFIDLTIALIASSSNLKNIALSFKTTFLDFIDGAKNYTKTFIVLLLVSIGFLAYTEVTKDFVPHIKKRQELFKYRRMKVNPYRVKGNILGVENAKVVIELYSDYVCPLCYINNIMLHKAAKEFSNIKIVHHNFPFDKECNEYLDINIHPHACFMSKAAIASRNQNNYWEMSSLLYEKQPRTEEKLIKLVEELNFDKEIFLRDLNSNETKKELYNEIKLATEQNINATPTMFINGEKYVGVKPYYELKGILKKHGAR